MQLPVFPPPAIALINSFESCNLLNLIRSACTQMIDFLRILHEPYPVVVCSYPLPLATFIQVGRLCIFIIKDVYYLESWDQNWTMQSMHGWMKLIQSFFIINSLRSLSETLLPSLFVNVTRSNWMDEKVVPTTSTNVKYEEEILRLFSVQTFQKFIHPTLRCFFWIAKYNCPSLANWI